VAEEKRAAAALLEKQRREEEQAAARLEKQRRAEVWAAEVERTRARLAAMAAAAAKVDKKKGGAAASTRTPSPPPQEQQPSATLEPSNISACTLVRSCRYQRNCLEVLVCRATLSHLHVQVIHRPATELDFLSWLPGLQRLRPGTGGHSHRTGRIRSTGWRGFPPLREHGYSSTRFHHSCSRVSRDGTSGTRSILITAG
jgi:hypothetical protein